MSLYPHTQRSPGQLCGLPGFQQQFWMEVIHCYTHGLPSVHSAWDPAEQAHLPKYLSRFCRVSSIPLAKINHITKPRNQRGYSSLSYKPHQRWEWVGWRISTAGQMTSWPQPPRPVDFLGGGGGASFEIISQLRGGSCWYKWELSIVIYEIKDSVKEKARAAS